MDDQGPPWRIVHDEAFVGYQRLDFQPFKFRSIDSIDHVLLPLPESAFDVGSHASHFVNIFAHVVFLSGLIPNHDIE